MIHVCYGLCDINGRYSKFCGTSIVSIFENTVEHVTVHILHDDSLTADNRDKFMYLAGQYNQQIKFYNVEELASARINQIKNDLSDKFDSPATIGTFYRLIMLELLPSSIDKIIYLDAGDTIVHLDIKKLWSVDLKDYPIAAVPDFGNVKYFPQTLKLCTQGIVKYQNYFNAGLIVLSLSHLRFNINKIWEGADRPSGYEFLVRNFNKLRYLDQDVLNYCFSDQYLKLPDTFNCILTWERMKSSEHVIEQKIYHFAGSKPLQSVDIFSRLYLEYFSKTPWFNADIFDGIINFVNAQLDRQKHFMLNVTNLLAHKQRAFFVEPQYLDGLRALFDINKDEPVYNSSASDAINKLIDVMRSNADNVLVFILAGNYFSISNQLIAQNFVENRDFINVTQFLTSHQGVSINFQSVLDAL